MILNNKIYNLVLSDCIRIIAALVILYRLPIPLFVKIILIMISDSVDCGIPRILFNHWIDCSTDTYQRLDKITDTICYTFLLFYILKNGDLSTNYNYLLIVLYIYRLIGVFLFLIKNDRKDLFYFPNFFLEISLGLMVINYFPTLKKYREVILLLIAVYKILAEYYLHYR